MCRFVTTNRCGKCVCVFFSFIVISLLTMHCVTANERRSRNGRDESVSLIRLIGIRFFAVSIQCDGSIGIAIDCGSLEYESSKWKFNEEIRVAMHINRRA